MAMHEFVQARPQGPVVDFSGAVEMGATGIAEMSPFTVPRILIYADPLLAPSATFVRSQAEALRNFLPYYVGARAFRGRGLALPKHRTILINSTGSTLGKIKEIPFKVFGRAPGFYRRMRRVAPVLLHAHGGPSALSVLPIARQLQIPLIATFHGSDVTVDPTKARGAHYTAKSYWRRKGILAERAQLCIAVSQFICARLLEQGYPPSKTLVHYIGVDTLFFNASQAVSRQPDVLFVGTLHEVKGCEYLIRAMTHVQALVADARMIVIGDGPLRAHLEMVASQQIRNFHFLGAQPPEVVREWMNRAKVFCVPSVRDHSGATEALGLVFLEAQSMGLPVASFRSGGIPEAVAHGDTGFLSDEGDYQELAKSIVLLLTNREIWATMSAAGRRRVERHFDLMKQTAELEELYNEVICSASQG